MPLMPDDDQPDSDANKILERVMEGGSLSAAAASALEEALLSNPADFDSRALILGYYSKARFRSSEAKRARIPHIAWVVVNQPSHTLALDPTTMVHRSVDFLRNYIEIRELWNQQVAAHQNIVNVLNNAASFFFLDDNHLAEKCPLRAIEVEPKNPRWYERLAHLYKLMGTSFEQMAFEQLERCLELVENPEQRFDVLWQRPRLALNAGHLEKAKLYADAVLALLKSHKGHFAYGMALQDAHITLGKSALKAGDIVKAQEHLLLSVPNEKDTPGIFLGQPDGELAAELFEAGVRESVLEWIELCSSFINVQSWRQKVRSGISAWEYELEERRRYYCLSKLPRIAFDRAQWVEARQAVDDFYAISKNYKTDPRHYGFGLHTSQIVMGQLALRSGDKAKALGHLNLAGQVPCAERLRERGPDMALAMELMQLGEKDVVIAFLKDCERLWSSGKDSFMLTEWTNDIESDKIPTDWELLYS